MIKDGDLVFFKSVKTRPNSKGIGVTYKGHGFGIILGHQQKHMPEPTPHHIKLLIGTIGWVSFDDISEAMGAKVAQDMIAFVEKKYNK